jgi:hypothetical protein
MLALRLCLTKRAPDVWDSAAFSSIFLASSFSCSQTESTPAHTQVTQTVNLTKRAPDKWESARFTSIFLASGFSCSQALSTPAHLRVTQTVGQKTVWAYFNEKNLGHWNIRFWEVNSPNKACTRRWGFWRDSKHFSTPQHFPSRTAFRRPPQRG